MKAAIHDSKYAHVFFASTYTAKQLKTMYYSLIFKLSLCLFLADALKPDGKHVLLYKFKLLAIRNSPPPINMFKEMDSDGNNGIEKEEVCYNSSVS